MCQTSRHTGRPEQARSGFSLMELLVAISILTVLLITMMGLFSGSIRAIKSGQQAMDANQMARSALNVMERDLSRAFTSRDAGDYYQFYGCPIGMMFVGMVRVQDPQTGFETTQLARVTYVLFNNEYQADDSFETISGGTIFTYSLVRYIEVGCEDLDTFPGVDWDSLSASAEYNIGAELAELNNLAVTPYWTSATYKEKAELTLAKKRELWLRMLSRWEQGSLPDAWAFLPPDRYGNPIDPYDYVIADNIQSVVPPTFPSFDPTETDPDDIPPQRFFRYGRVGLDSSVEYADFWNSVQQAPQDSDTVGNKLPGNPLKPRLPEVVWVSLSYEFASPYPGAPDHTRPVTLAIDVPSAYTRADLKFGT